MTPNLNNYSQGYINLTKPATVATLKDRLNLKNLTPEIDLSKRSIETFSISRLALQLTGFFDYFEYKLVQVIGRDEQEYMKRLSDDVLTERLEKITSYNVPCIIISGNLRVKEPVIEVCKRSGVPLLRSERETSDMDSEIIKTAETGSSSVLTGWRSTHRTEPSMRITVMTRLPMYMSS